MEILELLLAPRHHELPCIAECVTFRFPTIVAKDMIDCQVPVW